jgi:hypothetical protein
MDLLIALVLRTVPGICRPGAWSDALIGLSFKWWTALSFIYQLQATRGWYGCPLSVWSSAMLTIR